MEIKAILLGVPIADKFASKAALLTVVVLLECNEAVRGGGVANTAQ